MFIRNRRRSPAAAGQWSVRFHLTVGRQEINPVLDGEANRRPSSWSGQLFSLIIPRPGVNKLLSLYGFIVYLSTVVCSNDLCIDFFFHKIIVNISCADLQDSVVACVMHASSERPL